MSEIIKHWVGLTSDEILKNITSELNDIVLETIQNEAKRGKKTIINRESVTSETKSSNLTYI